MRQWLIASTDAKVRAFYYAGHGVQYRGSSYLIPIDAVFHAEDEIPQKAFNLTHIIDPLSRTTSGVNFVIMDACRADPSALLTQVQRRTRSLENMPEAGLGAAGRAARHGDRLFHFTRCARGRRRRRRQQRLHPQPRASPAQARRADRNRVQARAHGRDARNPQCPGALGDQQPGRRLLPAAQCGRRLRAGRMSSGLLPRSPLRLPCPALAGRRESAAAVPLSFRATASPAGRLAEPLRRSCGGRSPARAAAAAPWTHRGPFRSIRQCRRSGRTQPRLRRGAHQCARASGVAGRPLRLELVSLDSKGEVDGALQALQAAADRDIRVVLQGNSSGVAAGIIAAIEKHNQRNPGREILFLNYSAIDPALTREKCSFWHFRFDADLDMRLTALLGDDGLGIRGRISRTTARRSVLNDGATVIDNDA